MKWLETHKLSLTGKNQKMNNIKQITKLNVDNNSLKRFKDLPYKVWYALAEFIDNSLHSYLENKSFLNSIGIDSCDVLIRIDKDDNLNESLIIEDNAGGIHEDDFERLVSIGIRKEKSKHQLSEFGMGMKTAGIWLGNKITVSTKSFKTKDVFKIIIDLEKTNNEVDISESQPISNLPCYTKVVIEGLNRNLTHKTTLKNTKDSLANMFKKFIEKGDLNLYYQGEKLESDNYKLLDINGELVKKDFEIILSNGKTAKGWVGILNKDYTSEKRAGFYIYRFDRLLCGYPENTWKPSEIYGGYGQKSTKVIGEIDMSDFQVAHTKNAINFVLNEEEEFINQLKEACGLYTSEQYVRNLEKPSDSLSHHNTKSETKKSNQKLSEIVNDENVFNLDDVVIQVESKDYDTEQFLQDQDVVDLEPVTVFDFLQGTDYEIEVEIYEFYSSSKPNIIFTGTDLCLKIFINVGHKYFVNIVSQWTYSEQMQYKLNCVFDTLSEYNVKKRKGKIDPNQIRLVKSMLLKNYANTQENNY